MSSMRAGFSPRFAVAGLLAVLVGCAGVPQGPGKSATGDPAQVVRERAQQRWDAIVAGDLEKAYGFLSPASRQVNSLAVYSTTVKVGFWKKVEVESVACPEADVCEAALHVQYVHRGSVVETPSRETWTRIDGQWWYVLR
jgi:hypothetical protein